MDHLDDDRNRWIEHAFDHGGLIERIESFLTAAIIIVEVREYEAWWRDKYLDLGSYFDLCVAWMVEEGIPSVEARAEVAALWPEIARRIEAMKK